MKRRASLQFWGLRLKKDLEQWYSKQIAFVLLSSPGTAVKLFIAIAEFIEQLRATNQDLRHISSILADSCQDCDKYVPYWYPFRFSIKFYLLLLMFFLCFVDELVLFDNLFSHAWFFLRFCDQKKKNHHFNFFFFLILCFNHFVGFFFLFVEKMLEEIKNSISLMLYVIFMLCGSLFSTFLISSCVIIFVKFIFGSLESTFVFITSSSLASCNLYVSVCYIQTVWLL